MPFPRSMAEVEAHNARVAAGRRRALGPGGAQGPTTLEEQVPAGQEGELHEKILAECNRRGWYVVHSRMDQATTQSKGVLDFIIAADRGRVLWVEAKTKKSKPTTEQAGTLFWLARLGHRCTVVRSMAEFLDFIADRPHSD